MNSPSRTTAHGRKNHQAVKEVYPNPPKLVFKHLLYLKEMRLELRTAASQSVCESFFLYDCELS